MTIGSQSTLFMGVTPASGRDFMGRIFTGAKAAGYTRVIVPCAGRFSGPLMALRAGYQPDQIIASDISMYSAILGELAAGRDPRGLNVKMDYPLMPDLHVEFETATDEYHWAACALLALKVSTSPTKNPYLRMIHDDMVRGWKRHLDVLEKGLRAAVAAIKGIHYHPRDMFAEIEQYRDDAKTVMFVLPPQYPGGFAKQFDTKGVLTWNEPPSKQFDSKGDHHKLYDLATAPETKALMLFWMIQRNMKDGYAERATWVLDRKGLFGAGASDVVEYVLSNRPDEVKAMTKGPVVGAAKKAQIGSALHYPVWGNKDDRITEDSTIQFMKTKRDVGLYYRDLFAHGLGDTNTERFVLMIVDGKVFGTIGIHSKSLRLGQRYKWQPEGDDKLYLWESYGFNASNENHKYLNRLLMMCICSEEFWKFIRAQEAPFLHRPHGLATACIARHPEVLVNRGILKLMFREQQADGRYYLAYATPWKPGTYKDQLKLWLKKYGKPPITKTTEASDEQ